MIVGTSLGIYFQVDQCLSSDGETLARTRTVSLINDLDSKAAVMDLWNLGWSCF